VNNEEMPPPQSKMKQPGINAPPSANQPAPASTQEEAASPWGPTTDIPANIGKNGLQPMDMAGDPSAGWGHLVSAAEAKKWDEVQKIIDMRANLDQQATTRVLFFKCSETTQTPPPLLTNWP